MITTQSNIRHACGPGETPLFSPRDIAVQLSRIDVYNGTSAAGFYSFAQHSAVLFDFFRAGTIDRAIALAAFTDRLVFGTQTRTASALIEDRISGAAKTYIARMRRDIIERHARAFASSGAVEDPVNRHVVDRVLSIAADMTDKIDHALSPARMAPGEALPVATPIPLPWDKAADEMIRRMRSIGVEV